MLLGVDAALCTGYSGWQTRASRWFYPPRNRSIPANANPGYFDLGLCGPFRTHLAQHNELCGAFKVPTLRNIALTAPYLHNGHLATLREVVEFYVARDTDPQRWYATASRRLASKFNDLPKQYAVNVNTTEVPYNRHPGDQPALNPNEIDDLLAFLQTLTDGYQHRGKQSRTIAGSRELRGVYTIPSTGDPQTNGVEMIGTNHALPYGFSDFEVYALDTWQTR